MPSLTQGIESAKVTVFGVDLVLLRHIQTKRDVAIIWKVPGSRCDYKVIDEAVEDAGLAGKVFCSQRDIAMRYEQMLCGRVV